MDAQRMDRTRVGIERDPGSSSILSDRLELIAMTPDFLRASVHANISGAARLLGRSLPVDWPIAHAALFAMRLKQLEADSALQPWLLRAIASRESGEIVGHIGFHSAPGPEYLRPFSRDAVEFGFTIYAAFRRKGYAREASIALLRWASERHGVKAFVMTIRPDNIPSQALARQLGFIKIGSHVDEVDGVEDVLEYRVDQANGCLSIT